MCWQGNGLQDSWLCSKGVICSSFLSTGDGVCRSVNLKLVLREFLFSFFIFFKGREIRNWSAETYPTSKHFGNGCSKLPVHENPNVWFESILESFLDWPLLPPMEFIPCTWSTSIWTIFHSAPVVLCLPCLTDHICKPNEGSDWAC